MLDGHVKHVDVIQMHRQIPAAGFVAPASPVRSPLTCLVWFFGGSALDPHGLKHTLFN